MFRYAVIEYQRKASDIILIDTKLAAPKPVWNILFSVPYDTRSDQDTQFAFDACCIWLESNKAPGSKYVITEMFFIDEENKDL